MDKRHLLPWLMIFVAGCSTLAPAAIEPPLSASGGSTPGTQAPFATDASKTKGGDFENGGTAAADQGPENTQKTEKNPKPAENGNSSGAGQNETNKRADKDEEYFFPSPLLPYDGIAPVYKPQFVTAAESPLMND